MYGYIRPNQDELRIREYTEYRAYYCGLCKCLSAEYGEIARSVLSYDCTFIALLLSGLAGTDDVQKRRCVYKPLSKPRLAAAADDMLRFAADMDVLLAYYKLEDDWRDDKNPAAVCAKAALGGAMKKAANRQPEMDRAIFRGLKELGELEKANCSELDAPADAFARMMKSVGLSAPIENRGDRIALAHTLYHLGRWVYLIDAWDDRDKDKKKGSYNPFIASGADKDRAEFLLNCSLNEAINAYQLLNLLSHEGLLDNIILDGCPAKNREVLGGKDE